MKEQHGNMWQRKPIHFGLHYWKWSVSTPYIWSFSYLWTHAKQQLTNPRYTVEVQNLNLVVKVDFFLKLEEKLKYTSSNVKCAQIFLWKTKPECEKGNLICYYSCFQILVTPRAWSIIYLKCIISSEFPLGHSGTHVSFPPGHLVHDIHIKEDTVEVVKQILHRCTIPTSWTICFF